MDEFNVNFTINELISKEKIEIKSVYLLSDNGGFIIAINWLEGKDTHFKMFKKQSIYSVKAFNHFLLEYDPNWFKLASDWLATPSTPLHLKPYEL